MVEKNSVSGLPDTMRALVVGHGSTWKLVERDVPRPGEGEVLVRVHAAASNNGDIPMIDGAAPPPHRAAAEKRRWPGSSTPV